MRPSTSIRSNIGTISKGTQHFPINIRYLVMSTILHSRRVRREFVHVLHAQVESEGDDGGTEAGERILPKVGEERVAPPGVLSSEGHGGVSFLD